MSEFKFLTVGTLEFVERKFVRSCGRSIKAKVVKVGEAYTSSNNACTDYSGCVGRWREYTVFVTSGGNLVIQRHDYSQWQGETTRYFVHTFDTIDNLKKFFDQKEDENGAPHIGKAERYLLAELSSLGIDLAEEIE